MIQEFLQWADRFLWANLLKEYNEEDPVEKSPSIPRTLNTNFDGNTTTRNI